MVRDAAGDRSRSNLRGLPFLRIIFVHRTIVDYTVETPYLRAVGGAEAAVSYVAAELPSLGDSVVHLAHTSAAGTFLGVQCVHLHAAVRSELLNRAAAGV